MRYKLALFVLIILFIFNKCQSQYYEFDLEEQFLKNVSFPNLYINTINNRLRNSDKVSKTCQTHIHHYLDALVRREFWAAKMFDAGTKISSGYLDAHIVDYGSYDECMEIETNILGQQVYGKYCLLTIPMNISRAIKFKFAICFPDTCSNKDVQEIYSFAQTGEKACQSKLTQPKLGVGAIASITFFAIMLAIAISSTIFEAYLVYAKKEAPHLIILAFSFLHNGKKLLTVNNSHNQISCIYGIRVITMIWIIYGHRLKSLTEISLQNPLYIFEYLNDNGHFYTLNSSVSVDTFLFLSGLMVSYGFLVATQRSNGKFNVPQYYLHRYLRLTPAYGAIILMYATLLIHFGSGPNWIDNVGSHVEKCQRLWWHALLYIQNYTTTAPCVGQSWYLSIDMQLFILSPVILIILKRSPKLGLGLAAILGVASIVAAALVGWYYKYYGYEMANAILGKNYMKNFYYPTHTRAAPWCIGIMVGYLVYQLKQKNLKISFNKIVVVLIWLFSLGILICCLVIGHRKLLDKSYDRLSNTFHLALLRPVWTIGIAGVIFMCVLNYGGPINKFLSAAPFEILSRLTYSMYLTHRFFQYVQTNLLRVAPVASQMEMFYQFCGDLVMCTLTAVMLSFLFESPILTIEKIIFGKPKKKLENKDTNVL